MGELFTNEVNPARKQVKHIGLTSTDPLQIKTLAQRVIKFNQKHGTNVRMEVLPPDPLKPDEPVQLVFVYDDNDVKFKFWME